MKMPDKTTDRGLPIAQPSICLINRSFTENRQSEVNLFNNLFIINLEHKGFNLLRVYISSKMYSMVSSIGTFVKRDSTSYDMSSSSSFNGFSSKMDGNSKGSLMMYLLSFNGFRSSRNRS